MNYQAPLADIGFALKYGAGLGQAIEEGLFGDLTVDVVDAVLEEAGRLAGEVIAPLNRVDDCSGSSRERALWPPSGSRATEPVRPNRPGSP